MRAGQRVAGRWQLVAPVEEDGPVARWRAVDAGTGEPLEVLALRPPEAHPPARHQAFAEAHRAVMRARDPALVRVHATEWEGPVALAVRAPLEDATLADLAGPLAPGVVAGIGARVLPAVVAAGGATGGALSARDIGLDAGGQPVLAPRGAADGTSHAAPEAFSGRPPDATAALYGLGVVLHRLATGRDPQRGAGGALVPPGSWRPLPPALDGALRRLLSATPEERPSALPLLVEAASPLPDLRTLAPDAGARPATLVPGEVKLTAGDQTAVRHARADVPRPRAAVALRQLGRLDPAGRSRAAGFASVPLRVVDELAEQNLPLVVEPHAGRSGLDRRAADLRRESDLPLEVIGRARARWILLALASGLAAVLALGVAGVLSAWLPLVVAGAFAVLGLVGGGAWLLERLAWGRALAGLEALRALESVPEQVRRRQERVAALRRKVASTALPAAADSDVRGALKEVDRHLDALGRIGASAEDTLSSVDVAQLRTRLGVATGEERDRLARTVVDLEALQAHRLHLDDELARIDRALDDLGAVLARVGDEGSDAVDRLQRTTQLARESLVEPRRPERERT